MKATLIFPPSPKNDEKKLSVVTVWRVLLVCFVKMMGKRTLPSDLATFKILLIIVLSV